MRALPIARHVSDLRPTDRQRTLEVQVARKWVEAEDICCLELIGHEERPLPAFDAGAHLDVHLPNGLVRQYSLCNNPGERGRYVIAVLKEPATRGGSRAMHDLVVGQIIHVSEPRNFFPLRQEAQDSVLIAGGIGITPLICMAEALALRNSPFELHYRSRSRMRTAFHDRLVHSPFSDKVRFYLDEDHGRERFELSLILGRADAGRHLYVCGPQGLVEEVLSFARTRGWREPQLHAELFSQNSVAQGERSFEVELVRSGKVVTVGSHMTVVQALVEAGVPLAVSCGQGICGTCLTTVLAGEPDHRDTFLTPEERMANDQFLPCCSRSLSRRLVLDA